MKKFKLNKDKLLDIVGYGFWIVYAGLVSATIYGTIYHFSTISKIKKQGDEILKIVRGY